MLHYLLIGTVLGLSAGLAPGPLLTLVISETLKHDIRAGIKVALAPVFTDLPIILLTLFVLSSLSDFDWILGIISLLGGLFVLHMGYDSMKTTGVELALDKAAPKSFFKGILTNILSPHPYLFWFSVGAPTMTKAMSISMASALVFIVSFYVLMVGTKAVLAIIVGRSKSFLNDSWIGNNPVLVNANSAISVMYLTPYDVEDTSKISLILSEFFASGTFI